MGKRYDVNVTPQNTPHFGERKALFLLAMVMLVLNLILIGGFLGSNKALYFAVASILAVWALTHYFLERRREMWAWGYTLLCIILSLIAPVPLILWHKAYLWFIGYGVELGVFAAVAAGLLKRIKPRKK